jgi:hypothetical protein
MLGFTRCASTACFTQAAEFIVGVPLCDEHIEALREHFVPPKNRPKIDMAEIFRIRAENDASRTVITERVRLTPEQSGTDPGSAEALGCVYYITWRKDDEYIKIGTSQKASARFKQLTTYTGDRPRLLVAEPGGRSQEALRHDQFAHLRKPGTELFQYTSKIVDHIAELRERFPYYRDLTDVGRTYD